jgi:ubiquinone/menaquinone biosynthesis C-methylase UbiE
MRDEKSDSQFVEWSSGIHPDDYDVSEVAAFLNKQNGEKLNGLDVGGGIGSYAKALASRCNRSVAITVVDPGKLVQEKFLESDDLNLVSQDFLEFNTDSKFDFIILKTVLHHIVTIP